MTSSEPFAFPADAATNAHLIDGPITDLNVMSRRGVVRHTLSRTVMSEPIRIAAASGEDVLLLVQGGRAMVESGATQDTLFDDDSVLLPAGHEDVMMTPTTALTLHKVVFQRANT